MKRTNSIAALLLTALILPMSCTAVADDRDFGEAVHDARLEGQLWTSYALNRHLNPFKIDVEVRDGKATLTGNVEESVQRDLAAQIAVGIDGIDEVDNRITVVQDRDIRDEPSAAREFGDRIKDATTTATVKSKLLWNRNTAGMAINVSTDGGVVTLEGRTDSDASRQLAERLAANTDGVAEVRNQLTVAADARRSDAERGAGEVISDTWITSKVKSTLLFSNDVSGTDISVETRDGVVRLEGKVDSDAEKALAIQLASDIRGVRQVDDSGLRVAESS